MPKSSSAQSEAKIKLAIEGLKVQYSFSEFRNWKSNEWVKSYQIGAGVPQILVKLGAIEMKYGVIKLNERINSIKASTVRKHLNNYVNGTRKVQRARKFEAQPKLAFNMQDIDLKDVIIALKKQIREEVIKELVMGLK